MFCFKVIVEVTDENGDAGNSLVVGGYTLTGSVTTDGKPTSGVSFVLHSSQDAQYSPGRFKFFPFKLVSISYMLRKIYFFILNKCFVIYFNSL